jgi:hypothetical protein
MLLNLAGFWLGSQHKLHHPGIFSSGSLAAKPGDMYSFIIMLGSSCSSQAPGVGL